MSSRALLLVLEMHGMQSPMKLLAALENYFQIRDMREAREH